MARCLSCVIHRQPRPRRVTTSWRAGGGICRAAMQWPARSDDSRRTARRSFIVLSLMALKGPEREQRKEQRDAKPKSDRRKGCSWKGATVLRLQGHRVEAAGLPCWGCRVTVLGRRHLPFCFKNGYLSAIRIRLFRPHNRIRIAPTESGPALPASSLSLRLTRARQGSPRAA